MLRYFQVERTLADIEIQATMELYRCALNVKRKTYLSKTRLVAFTQTEASRLCTFILVVC